MQINYRNFPHPVLSHFSDDYVRSAFQTTVEVSSSARSYRLAIKNALGNGELRDAIESGLATFCIHVECRATRYRQLHRSRDTEFEIEVPADQVDGTVDICCLILANTDIPAYVNGNFHADFGGATFPISRGDILAVAEDRSFDADKQVDQLKKIPSIFSIQANTDRDAPPIDVSWEGHKIVVLLAEKIHNHYKFIRQSQDMHVVLASMVVVPVLVETLLMLKDSSALDEADYGERRWYKSIGNRLNEIGFPVGGSEFQQASPLSLAQKLIDGPLDGAMTVLEKLLEED